MLKKVVSFLLLMGLLLGFGYLIENPAEHTAFLKPAEIETKYEIVMKQDLLCMMLAYPEFIKDIQLSKDDKVYFLLKSGSKVLYDDKKEKNAAEKLNNPDVQDMLEPIYPLEPIKKLMDKSFDPGRSRIYELLHEAYGKTKQEIEANLTNVKVGSKSYQFNASNKAAEALKAVMQELIPLTQQRADVRACVFPGSGTYNYRTIAETNRLSSHSFGIAIDLARDKRDYWKWASAEEGQKRLEAYPKEIAEIFEKNNFVWGGKWGHFDILHFEYRPEIILKARYFGKNNSSVEVWYDGVPAEDAYVKKCIDRIEQIIS